MQRPASCDFLHGPLTSQHAVTVVKEALAAGQEKHFEILYYRKDGKYNWFVVLCDLNLRSVLYLDKQVEQLTEQKGN